MGKLNLMIANAGKYFTDSDIRIIKNAAAATEAFIGDHFEAFDYAVDVIVTEPTYMVGIIEEDSVGGRTFSSRLIGLSLDKKQAKINKNFIFETLCHEMSHSLRWEKLPERFGTLFDGMVFEGLATLLEEKAVEYRRGGSSSDDDRGNSGGDGDAAEQFFLKVIRSATEAEYAQMIKALKSSFESEDYDYETIFFGGNDQLPRWTGYHLGYYYAKKYLEKTGRSIEEATLDSYKKIHDAVL